MHVPRSWSKATGETDTPAGHRRCAVWGWGDAPAEAQDRARQRLARLLERLRGGGDEPGEYDYGTRPLREEILHQPGAGALVTRNRYGAVVLNTAGLLFLDLDRPRRGWSLKRLFGGRSDPDEDRREVEERLARAAPRTTFRLYRTAAGWRAVAVDRPFDPCSEEVRALMRATGTDPAFARLCSAQKSFRARLTPKPWRCGLSNPPGEYPREDPGAQELFAAWLDEYVGTIADYATCHFATTVGTGRAVPELEPLVALHDEATRCTSGLELA